MTFLKNKHISLRAVEPDDLRYLYELENKESARLHGISIMPHSKYILKNFIKNADKDITETKQLRLIIEHNESCEIIGTIDLFAYSSHHQRAGVGIWLDEEWQHKGYGTEALESLCSFAFDTLLLHQLFCHIAVDNINSLKLFKHVGFVETSLLKHWVRTKNGFCDISVLQKINKTPQ